MYGYWPLLREQRIGWDGLKTEYLGRVIVPKGTEGEAPKSLPRDSQEGSNKNWWNVPKGTIIMEYGF